MRKIRGIQRQKTDWRVWRLSLAFNLLILGVMLMLFYPKYVNKADIVMENLLYGTISGLQTSHLVFSNVILGKILGVFVALFPNGAWYTFFQIFFILTALTGIGYVILKRLPGAAGKVLLLFILCFLGYESYVTIGYLRTACLLTLSGSLLYTTAFRDGKEGLCAENVFAFVLLIISSLYSFWVFCLVFAVCILLPVTSTLIARSWRRLLRLAIDAAVIVLVCAGLWGVDCLSYRNTDPAYVLEYRNDFEMNYFKDAKQSDLRFDEVPGVEHIGQGWAISQGVFLNGSEEVLLTVRAIARQTKEFSSDTLPDFFRSVPVSLFSVDAFYLWFGLMIFFLAFSKERSRALLPSFAVVLIGSFVIWFINAQNSSTAYFILFVVASVHLLSCIGELRAAEWRPAAAFAAVLFIVLYSRFSGTLLTTVLPARLRSGFFRVSVAQEYLIDLDRYCLGFNAFTPYPTDLVRENVVVVNGFYSTMTDYDQPELESSEAEKRSWVSNLAGFPMTDLADFSITEDISDLSMDEDAADLSKVEEPADLSPTADPADFSTAADPEL